MKKTISLILCVFCLFYTASIGFAATMSDDLIEPTDDANVVDNAEKTEDNESFDEISLEDDIDITEDVNADDEDLENDNIDTDDNTDEDETYDSEELDDMEMYENDDEADIEPIAYTATSALSDSNIALGKKVTTSGEQPGNEASHIVDGDLERRWSVEGFNNYVTVDLGEEYTLGYSRIFVHDGTERSYQYKISVSNNGTNFRDIVDMYYNYETKRVFLDELNGETARYVRLTITGGSYNWVSISEFEIYPFDAEVNWATAGTVTEYSAQQDDNGNKNYAKNLIDGDLNTRWSARQYPNHVVIDLGAPRAITRTEVVPIENRAYKYKIEASLDGKNYFMIVNYTGGSPIMENDLTPVKARFIKFTVTDYTAEWISISELRVIGTLSNVVAPITDTSISLIGNTISMTATSEALYGGTVTLVAAVFDGNSMVEIKECQVELYGRGGIARGDLTLSSDLTGKTIEAFVWDTDETMLSCSETFSFSR